MATPPSDYTFPWSDHVLGEDRRFLAEELTALAQIASQLAETLRSSEERLEQVAESSLCELKTFRERQDFVVTTIAHVAWKASVPSQQLAQWAGLNADDLLESVEAVEDAHVAERS